MELRQRLLTVKKAVITQRPYADAIVHEYLSALIEDLEAFRFDPDFLVTSQAIRKSVADFLPLRNNYIEFVLFLASYRSTPRSEESVFAFLEQILSFQCIPIDWTDWRDTLLDHYRFYASEIFLYTIAALIKYRRYAFAARLIEGEYTFQDPHGGTSYRSCGIEGFSERIKSLGEHRHGELILRAEQATGDLFFERAKGTKVSFAELLQVDVLLTIRQFFPDPGLAKWWVPRCLVHCENGTTLPLFARASSGRGWIPMKQLLKIRSPIHLANCMAAMFEDRCFASFINVDDYWHVDWHTLLNTEKIYQKGKEDPAGYRLFWR